MLGVLAAEGAAGHTIRASGDRVTAIGAFRPYVDPTLSAALRAFGPTTSREPIGSPSKYGCTARWRTIGLTIGFANFGLDRGHTACEADRGRIGGAVIKGPAGRRAWRTSAGLRVGSRENRIPVLHPGARKHADGWWLVTGSSPYGGDCPCPIGVLRAVTVRGRVTSLRIHVGAAGD